MSDDLRAVNACGHIFADCDDKFLAVRVKFSTDALVREQNLPQSLQARAAKRDCYGRSDLASRRIQRGQVRNRQLGLQNRRGKNSGEEETKNAQTIHG